MELELVPKSEPATIPENPGAKEKPLVYTGPERRRGLRRITVDRREMARFEARTDRRHGVDRRADLKLWDGRNF
jgi:hypothetical protein